MSAGHHILRRERLLLTQSGHRDKPCRLPHYSGSRDWSQLLPIQVVFIQKFGPKILWRGGNVWPTLWRKVHEIPIQPNRIDMIHRRFSSPEMKNLSIPPLKYMHYWPLHIIRVSLALVIGLIERVRSGNQRNLRPTTLLAHALIRSAGALAIATNAAPL
jgi:hypothetical protein